MLSIRVSVSVSVPVPVGLMVVAAMSLCAPGVCRLLSAAAACCAARGVLGGVCG